tara:strand:+ start:4190 stop:4501 length:312 start_codon:yes stop_codon:yes gene_type:complete
MRTQVVIQPRGIKKLLYCPEPDYHQYRIHSLKEIGYEVVQELSVEKATELATSLADLAAKLATSLANSGWDVYTVNAGGIGGAVVLKRHMNWPYQKNQRKGTS